MNFTGERFVPGVGGVIEAEHLHRYLLARVIASGRDVLDVACGEGYGSHLLAGVARSVVGVDIANEAVAHACATYQTPNLEYRQGDCGGLPLETASIDLVVSFETIEHHDRHEAMMREIRRVLRPGGVLLISSPNRPEYDRTLSEPNPYHIKELDFPEFTALLQTHFDKTAFYAQRVLTASVVVPCQHVGDGFTSFAGDKAGSVNTELERPIYFLAVAGDGDLPNLGTSIYEGSARADASSPATFLEARVYLSEWVNGVAQPYTEARGAVEMYAMDDLPHTLRLGLPSDLHLLTRLRLDIANAPAAIILHALTLHSATEEEIWRWDGDYAHFVSPGGVMCFSSAEGPTLLCLNNDPQFDLAVPQEILAKVTGGASLRIELTPRPLLDALPRVLARIQAPPKAGLPALAGAHLPAGISNHLDEIAGLLKMHIEQKNSRIASQQTELESLHARQQQLYEQLIRAEAQLDLLKEFALQEGGARLDRL